MTQANDTDPTTKPSTGPQLVIEKLPFDSASGERYKWRLEEDGRLLVLGAGDFSTSWDASRDAARAALSLLHNLSMSYCRLGEEVSKVQEIARAKFEAAKKNGETGGTVQKFASAHATKSETHADGDPTDAAKPTPGSDTRRTIPVEQDDGSVADVEI